MILNVGISDSLSVAILGAASAQALGHNAPQRLTISIIGPG